MWCFSRRSYDVKLIWNDFCTVKKKFFLKVKLSVNREKKRIIFFFRLWNVWILGTLCDVLWDTVMMWNWLEMIDFCTNRVEICGQKLSNGSTKKRLINPFRIGAGSYPLTPCGLNLHPCWGNNRQPHRPPGCGSTSIAIIIREMACEIERSIGNGLGQSAGWK